MTRKLEQLRSMKIHELMESYKSALTSKMVSACTGEVVEYGYDQQDQLNYSKWANTLALNPSKQSVRLGTISHGVIDMTREQFIIFMEDCEEHEMLLYSKRKAIELQIEQANSIDVMEIIDTQL